MTELKIAQCTHEAAKFACVNYHYSKRIPVNKLNHFGVWENGKFVGVIIYGMGASATLHQSLGVERFQSCELVRIALTKHETPVSRIISISLRLLKKANPKLRVVASFADTDQNHHGGVYQASNWTFTGKSAQVTEYYFNGKWRHATDVYKRLTAPQIKTLKTRKKPGKYRYLYFFDKSLIPNFKPLEYPKRMRTQCDGHTVEFHSTDEGSIPISPLQG